MSWGISITTIDFFCQSADLVAKVDSANSRFLDIELRPVDSSNLDDVLQYRNSSIRNIFKWFLENAQDGIYAYTSGKVVGHIWLWRAEGREMSSLMGVDAPRPSSRNLFGWLPIPGTWDFLYFCRAASDAATEALLSCCLRMAREGSPMGISVPRNDAALRESVVRLGFVYAHTYTRVVLLGFPVFHWQVNHPALAKANDTTR